MNGQNKVMRNPDAACGNVQTASSRRDFLSRTGMGLGVLALEAILQDTAPLRASAAAINPLAAHPAPLPAKAKAVIHIFAEGGYCYPFMHNHVLAVFSETRFLVRQTQQITEESIEIRPNPNWQ